MQSDKQHRMAIIISKRTLGDRVMPRHSTQANDISTRASMVASDAALFVFVLLHSAYSLLKLTTTVGGGGSSVGDVGELCGAMGRQCCSHARCRPPVNRSVQIVRLRSASVHSLTNDSRPQSIAICNLESAVSPRLNVSPCQHVW